MIHQYSVFDKVQDVVEVRQVPDVYNLPSGEIGKKKKEIFQFISIFLHPQFSLEKIKNLQWTPACYLMRLIWLLKPRLRLLAGIWSNQRTGWSGSAILEKQQ